jgi:hypothetical protein
VNEGDESSDDEDDDVVVLEEGTTGWVEAFDSCDSRSGSVQVFV